MQHPSPAYFAKTPTVKAVRAWGQFPSRCVCFDPTARSQLFVILATKAKGKAAMAMATSCSLSNLPSPASLHPVLKG